MRKANIERELELEELYGRPNRYNSTSMKTYDYVVFENDRGKDSIEAMLKKWYDKGVISGAIWSFHDKETINVIDQTKGIRKPIGTPKESHYHVLVQFTKDISANDVWLKFGELLNKDARNDLMLDYMKNYDQKAGDRPFPIYDIGSRVMYYLHDSKAQSFSYTQQDLHQMGRLFEEKTMYKAIKGSEVNVEDERYDLSRGTKFMLYLDEDIRDREDLAEAITNLCSLYNGKFYVDSEDGITCMLETEQPKTEKAVRFSMNALVHKENVMFPYEVFNHKYSSSMSLPESITVEEVMPYGYLEFSKDKEKNEEQFLEHNEREL